MVLLQMEHLDGSRQRFDKLLTKTHVAYALVQPQGKHNDIPAALAVVKLLEGTEPQLQALYDAKRRDLEKWPISPTRVYQTSRATFLGDERYQRAYMDFYSQELLQQSGRANNMAMYHLMLEPEPLIYGLFGNSGQPLVTLSDALELQSPIMVVQSLTLASVHYDKVLRDLLMEVQVAGPLSPTRHHQAPFSILQAIGHDGRFSNVVHQPGYPAGVRHVLTNKNTREALIHYLRLLDVSNPTTALQALSQLSLTLLTATHKQGKPAFDYYLANLPTLINSARILLAEFSSDEHSTLLLRGLWMMFVLTYITQMRPIVDMSVQLTGGSLPKQETYANWDAIFAEFRSDPLTSDSKYMDTRFLRTLRSIYELERHGYCTVGDGVIAAYKLRWQWRRWTGMGTTGGQGEGLNVRL